MDSDESLKNLTPAMDVTPVSDFTPSSDEALRIIEKLHLQKIELEMQNEELTCAYKELAVALDRFSELYDFAPVGYLSIDIHWNISQANLCFASMLGVERSQLINSALSKFIHEESQEQYFQILSDIAKSKTAQTSELRFQDFQNGSGGSIESVDSGVSFWGRLESKPMLDDNGEIYQINLSISDITEHRVDQELLHRQNFYDKLTELPSRHLFTDRFSLHLLHVKRSSKHGALLYIDIDNFKHVNDSLGHAVGDEVLRHVGKVLRQNIREIDTAARFGGDEFLVLLTNLNEDKDVAAVESGTIANKIRKALFETLESQNVELRTEVSIGIALFPDADKSVEDIICHADIAMYRAKNNGKSSIEFYDENEHDLLKCRLEMYHDLCGALVNNEFHIVYQPQLNQSREVVGAECLLRWQHPRRGAVSPSEFVPILEDGSLIIGIGEWVLTQACMQLVEWAELPAPFSHFTLAVNVSARQFNQDAFFDSVLAILDETGANPQRLVLEITENMLLVDIEKTIDKMNKLKEIGVTFAIDDFGTGYSSLSYIKRLPLDTLKIDQSFVHDIHLDADNAMLVGTMMAMAEHLNLKVVVEGVETAEEEAVLLDKQCQYFQGYLYSRPLSKEKFQTYVRCAANQ